MDKICTLIAIPSEIIEGSTYDILNKRWPQAACHDGINKVFNGSVADDSSIVISDEFPGGVEVDELILFLQPILFAEDRSAPILIKKIMMSQLYRSDEYQACCEAYIAESLGITNPNN